MQIFLQFFCIFLHFFAFFVFFKHKIAKIHKKTTSHLCEVALTNKPKPQKDMVKKTIDRKGTAFILYMQILRTFFYDIFANVNVAVLFCHDRSSQTYRDPSICSVVFGLLV